MAHFQSLTIFFPMWNEEDYIDSAVGAAREICTELVATGEIADYEILIVDDASTDRTPQMADAYAASDPHIRVVHHPVNRRLGGSLKTGFANARGELILYSDADLPFDLADLKKACRLMRYYAADIVSAYRHDRTAEGPRRAVYSFAYNSLIRGLFGLQLRDVNFSFKLCRRRIFEHVKITSEGSFIDVELLVRAHRYGYKIIQFGVDYFARTRGVSTLSSWPVIFKIVNELARLKPELDAVKPLPPEMLKLADMHQNARHPHPQTSPAAGEAADYASSKA